ncbi:MAG: RICIN domain-containing protein [Olsenella sp.]|nr:RICIN domain-containing protein [Olsenella sp.]
MGFESYNPRTSLKRMIVAGTAAAALTAVPGVALAAEPATSTTDPAPATVQVQDASTTATESATPTATTATESATPTATTAAESASAREDKAVPTTETAPASATTPQFVGVASTATTPSAEEAGKAATAGGDATSASSSDAAESATSATAAPASSSEQAAEATTAAPTSSSPTEAPKYERLLDDGDYAIATDVDYSKVLDVENGNASNMANVQIFGSNKSGAQQWHVTFDDASGYYTFTLKGTNEVLDLKNGDPTSGNNVWIYESNGTLAQRWLLERNGSGFYILSAKDKGLALDVTGARSESGTNVEVWSKNDSGAQRFHFLTLNPKFDEHNKQTLAGGDGLYTVELAKNVGKVLDVSCDSKDDGANVQLYSSNGTNAQKFYFEQDDEGFYTITVAGSGKVLDVDCGAITWGSNVQQFTGNRTDAQRWAVRRNADGSITLVNKGSGLALDLVAGGTADGTNLQTYEDNGTAAQRFTLKKVDYLKDGIYKISSLADLSKVLDINAASSADGAKAQAYESNDTLAQRFEVSLNEDGSFRIRTAASGGFLTQSSANSTDVVQRGNHTTAAVDMNTWKLVWQGGYYTVVRADTASSSAAGQKALSLEGTQNGKALKVASNTGSYDLKHFLFEQASLINDGLYEIVSRLGLDLDAAGAGATSGTNVQIYEKNNSVAQKYYVTSAGGGYYAITNAASGLALDVNAGSTENGANVHLWESNGTDAQRWTVVIADGGGITFINKASGKALDVAAANASNGANVQSFERNYTYAQAWSLSPTYLPGWVNVNGSWFNFRDDGTKVELSGAGYYALRTYGGRSTQEGSPYMFCVDTSACRLIVFKGSAWNWTPVIDAAVGVGTSELNSTNGGTLIGEFFYNKTPSYGYELGGSGPDQGDPQVYDLGGYYYYTSIWGGMGFHTVCEININDPSTWGPAEAAQTGVHISHGCIRCPVKVAKWIYDNMVTGSLTITY